MKLRSPRRLALVSVGVLAAGVLAAGTPVQAATGNLSYQCDIANNFNLAFIFNQDTNLPTTGLVGRVYSPIYTATATFPDNLVDIARSPLINIASFDGSIEATVYVNGHATTVTVPMKRTNVPPTGGLTLKASGPLAKLVKSSVGSVVYKPGNIKFTVNAYQPGGATPYFSVDRASCTMPGNAKTIDTVAFKYGSSISASVHYAKSSKKVTASAVVKGTKSAPTGKVAEKLVKNGVVLASKSVSIHHGKATTTFARLKAKGTYKVTFSYPGTGSLAASSASRSFTIK
jgi:hypothetical protein